MRRTVLVGLIVLAAAVCGVVLYAGRAEAQFYFYGRAPNTSYYSNQQNLGLNYVFHATADIPYAGTSQNWQTEVTTVDLFVSEMKKRLYSPTPDNSGRASGIINMMLGIDGGDARFNGPNADRSKNGVAHAKANFAVWEKAVRNYDAKGWVEWNDIFTTSSGWDWLGAASADYSIPLGDLVSEYLGQDSFENVEAIVFYNPNGTHFTILKKCANLLGDIAPLYIEPVVITPPPPPPTDKPFFDVKGGDIVAGSSFAHEKTDGTMVPCSSSEAAHNTNAGIVGQIRQPDYAGAGGEYAAFAWNRIQDFRTSRANTAGPAALSFANKNPEAQVNLSAGRFGGMFASAPCVDYWATKPAISTMTLLAGSPATPVDVGSLASDTYYRSGDLIIAGDSKVINKKLVTIYVNGNVSIQGGSSGHGVVYGGGSDTNWSGFDEIPTFKLVVRGSIFIDAGVTQLDGQYVAVPTQNYTTAANTFAAPLAGTISTCANGFITYRPADAATGMINTCGKQLTVNGSMSANQIWLLRTGGTTGSGLAAEVIQYGPENWLISPTGGSLNPEYDAVIGLPPIL